MCLEIVSQQSNNDIPLVRWLYVATSVCKYHHDKNVSSLPIWVTHLACMCTFLVDTVHTVTSVRTVLIHIPACAVP